MPKKTNIMLRATSVIFAGVMALASLIGIGQVDVQAANKDPQIAQLTSARNMFVYTVPYGNVPPASGDAVGYFELELKGSDLFNPASPADYLEIVKIEEYYYVTPINPEQDFDYITNISDYDLSTATNVREINYPNGEPAYFLRGDNLTTILTPQRTQDGGCTAVNSGGTYKGCNWDINDLASWNPDTGSYTDPLPAGTYHEISFSADAYNGPLGQPGGNYMGAYKIFVAIDPYVATPDTPEQFTQDVSELKFPNGYPGSTWPIGLQLNWDKAGDTDLLDPQATPAPTAQIIGSPQQGDSSYQVQVSGLKSIAGPDLNGPNAICSVTIGGTAHTSTGVTNGSCTITVNETVGSNIPAGTADVSDNGGATGTPAEDVRVFERTGIPYNGVTADVPSSNITNLSEISTVSCGGTSGQATAGGTTSCTVTLDPNRTLPSTFDLGVGSGVTPGGSCTQSGGSQAAGLVYNCSSIPVTSTPGSNVPVYGQIDTETPAATGETVDVISATTPITNDDIDDGNFAADSGLTCSPSPAIVNQSTTCVGTLPGGYLPPTSPEELFLNIEGQTPIQCAFSGSTFTCANLPVGPDLGVLAVQAAIYDPASPVAPADTGLTINVAAQELPRTGGEENMMFVFIGSIIAAVIATGLVYYKKAHRVKITKS